MIIKTWINSQLVELDSSNPDDAALINQKNSRKAADVARADAEASERERERKEQERLDAFRKDIGDITDVSIALAEGLEALSKGEALPTDTAEAIAKIKSVKTQHPKGVKNA